MAQNISLPDINEVVKSVTSEIGKQFYGLYPLLQAAGWALVIYFILLIIIAIVRFFRGRKQIMLLKEMNQTLKDIRDRLPEKKKSKKEDK